ARDDRLLDRLRPERALEGELEALRCGHRDRALADRQHASLEIELRAEGDQIDRDVGEPAERLDRALIVDRRRDVGKREPSARRLRQRQAGVEKDGVARVGASPRHYMDGVELRRLEMRPLERHGNDGYWQRAR